MLLEKGATVDAADSLGRTPLYRACSGAHLDVAKLLLEKGANVEAGTTINETALENAVGMMQANGQQHYLPIVGMLSRAP